MNVNGQFWKPLQYMDFRAVISGIRDKKEAGTKVPADQKRQFYAPSIYRMERKTTFPLFMSITNLSPKGKLLKGLGPVHDRHYHLGHKFLRVPGCPVVHHIPLIRLRAAPVSYTHLTPSVVSMMDL